MLQQLLKLEQVAETLNKSMADTVPRDMFASAKVLPRITLIFKRILITVAFAVSSVT